MNDFYRLLKNKKTGKTHCPICLNKLKIIEIIKNPNSKIKVFKCNKCKKYFSTELEEGEEE